MLPPPAVDTAPFEELLEPIPQRCPRCGAGELVRTYVTRGAEGEPVTLDWCTGAFDRVRRRLLRRGCGYRERRPPGEPLD